MRKIVLFALSAIFNICEALSANYEAVFKETANWFDIRYEFADRCCLHMDSTKIAIDSKRIRVGGKPYEVLSIGSWRNYKNGRTLLFECTDERLNSVHVKLCEYDNGIRLIILRIGKNGEFYWCSQTD